MTGTRRGKLVPSGVPILVPLVPPGACSYAWPVETADHMGREVEVVLVAHVCFLDGGHPGLCRCCCGQEVAAECP